jgi:hypothetical protein
MTFYPADEVAEVLAVALSGATEAQESAAA